MKMTSLRLSLLLTVLLLQACAGNNNTPMPASPYTYQATPSNASMYRSPPSDVAHALSGR